MKKIGRKIKLSPEDIIIIVFLKRIVPGKIG